MFVTRSTKDPTLLTSHQSLVHITVHSCSHSSACSSKQCFASVLITPMDADCSPCTPSHILLSVNTLTALTILQKASSRGILTTQATTFKLHINSMQSTHALVVIATLTQIVTVATPPSVPILHLRHLLAPMNSAVRAFLMAFSCVHPRRFI